EGDRARRQADLAVEEAAHPVVRAGHLLEAPGGVEDDQDLFGRISPERSADVGVQALERRQYRPADLAVAVPASLEDEVGGLHLPEAGLRGGLPGVLVQESACLDVRRMDGEESAQ